LSDFPDRSIGLPATNSRLPTSQEGLFPDIRHQTADTFPQEGLFTRI